LLVSLSVVPSVSLVACQPVYQTALSVFKLACLPGFIRPVWLAARLPACLPTRLPPCAFQPNITAINSVYEPGETLKYVKPKPNGPQTSHRVKTFWIEESEVLNVLVSSIF